MQLLVVVALQLGCEVAHVGHAADEHVAVVDARDVHAEGLFGRLRIDVDGRRDAECADEVLQGLRPVEILGEVAERRRALRNESRVAERVVHQQGECVRAAFVERAERRAAAFGGVELRDHLLGNVVAPGCGHLLQCHAERFAQVVGDGGFDAEIFHRRHIRGLHLPDERVVGRVVEVVLRSVELEFERSGSIFVVRVVREPLRVELAGVLDRVVGQRHGGVVARGNVPDRGVVREERHHGGHGLQFVVDQLPAHLLLPFGVGGDVSGDDRGLVVLRVFVGREVEFRSLESGARGLDALEGDLHDGRGVDVGVEDQFLGPLGEIARRHVVDQVEREGALAVERAGIAGVRRVVAGVNGHVGDVDVLVVVRVVVADRLRRHGAGVVVVEDELERHAAGPVLQPEDIGSHGFLDLQARIAARIVPVVVVGCQLGEVSVFLLDEVLKYNPDYDWHITKPFTATVIKDFKGTVEFAVKHIEGYYEEDTDYWKKGEYWEYYVLEVVGHGINKVTGKPINFVGKQTGI